MVFWDYQIGDLEAIGVRVDPEQIMVLEQGGEVLVIQHLLSPWCWEGDTSGTDDQNGDPVYIPVRMKACSPLDKFTPTWQRTDEDTVANHLDREHGEQWRLFPSYVGVVEHRVWEGPGSYDEGLDWARVWNGYPVMDQQTLALMEKIEAAARSRLYESFYEQLTMVVEWELSAEWDSELLWEDVSEWERLGLDPDQGMTMRGVFEELYANRIIARPEASPEEIRNLVPLQFAPMSDYLREEPEALALWNRMVYRRESSKRKVTQALERSRRSVFEYNEGTHYQ